MATSGWCRSQPRAAGWASAQRSGGSTPSAGELRRGDLDELRPGVYAFNDAQQLGLGAAEPGDLALAVVATVVSRPDAGRLVLDCGSKSLGADRAPYCDGWGWLPQWPDAVVTGLWEHHAVVSASGALEAAVGDRLAVVPNHVCSAVNLTRELVVVHDGAVVDRWPVDAGLANR